MASQKYFCYRCRDAGFPQEEVIFSGKDEQGKTILKNPADNSLHQHRQQNASITVVTPATNELMVLNKLQDLEGKIDLLTKLVYALSEQKQKQQHDQNPATLLNNR